MKAILEFDLNNHEEHRAHLRAIKGLDACLALSEIRSKLRAREKYDAEELTQEKFFDILSTFNIDLDELIS